MYDYQLHLQLLLCMYSQKKRLIITIIYQLSTDYTFTFRHNIYHEHGGIGVLYSRVFHDEL